MSVIITGMDMPNTCHECKYSQCYFYGKAWQTIDGMKDYRTERDKTCPLKSIDGLIERINKKANSGQWSEAVVYGMQKAIAIIKEYCEVDK